VIVNPPRLGPNEVQRDPLFEPLTYEKVVGINNLYNVDWLEKGVELARAVALIDKKNGERATGFLIRIDGDVRLMTNHHVLGTADEAEQAAAWLNARRSWDGVDQPRVRCEFDVAAFFHTNPVLDYTIVGVRQTKDTKRFGPLTTDDTAAASVNDYVAIPQCPDGAPMQICLTDNKVQAVFDDKVQYSADTAYGSSGAPVFDQDWRLVALHCRGGALSDTPEPRFWVNEGTAIGAILDDARGAHSAAPARGEESSSQAERADLPEPLDLYFLVFAELRSTVAKLLSPSDPMDEAMACDTIGTAAIHPAFADWMEGLHPSEVVLEAAVKEGCACGVAFDAVARTSGHESLKRTQGRRGFTDKPEDRAADVYRAAHRRFAKPGRRDDVLDRVASIATEVGDDASAVVPAFVRGLVKGGYRGANDDPCDPDDEKWPKHP
jgi:V8-like Glu-specific endopeptidase